MKLAGNRSFGLVLALLVTAVLVQTVNPLFLTPANLRDLLVQSAPYAVLAGGMAFVMVLGEIDVSVGSMIGLLAAVMGLLVSPSRLGLSPPAAIVAVLVLGTVLGLINGALVAVAGVPSIIVTLGMMTVYRGVTETLMAGEWITGLPPGLRQLGIGTVMGVPVPVLVAVVMVVALIVVGRQTRWGRSLYATGSNSAAAWARGVPVKKVRLQAFALLGFLAGVTMLIAVPQLSVVEAGLGVGWELTAITAVVVGGVAVAGGSGSVVGVALAVLLLGSVRTVLVFLRLGDQATYWEQAVQGLFILVAVLVDRAGRTRKAAVT